MSDRRNPYLILGIDYGAPKAIASRHFALAARRLKRNPDGPYDREDLTWALAEVEQLEANPADAIDIFRVPADADVFSPPGPGLLAPGPTALERRTEADDEQAVSLLLGHTTREVLHAVLTELAPLTALPAPYTTTERTT